MKRTEENTAAQGAAQPRFLISLRWSASLVAAVLVAAATLALGTITRDDTRKALNEEARLKLVLNTRDMAISCTDALLSDFPELTLVPLAKDLLRDRTEITDVVVLNHQQVIKGCADPRQVGNAWRSPDGWTPLAPAGLLNPGEQLSRQGKLLRMDCPIHYSGDMKGHLGSVVMTMDTSYLDGLLKAQMQRQMSVGLVLMGVGLRRHGPADVPAVPLPFPPSGRAWAASARAIWILPSAFGISASWACWPAASTRWRGS